MYFLACVCGKFVFLKHLVPSSVLFNYSGFNECIKIYRCGKLPCELFKFLIVNNLFFFSAIAPLQLLTLWFNRQLGR